MDPLKIPKTRVELHCHMDGAVRHETIWELSKAKNLPLPGDGTFRDLKNALVVRDPIDLGHFLAPFTYIIPCIQDDLVAIERIAYEFILDKAKDGVAYVEARFAPHSLLSDGQRDMPHLEGVVSAVWRGLQRGEKETGTKARILLCTLIGLNSADETLDLAQRTLDHGVVAIDIASIFSRTKNNDEVPIGGEEEKVFQRAAKIGLHRTVHAGERGGAEMVRRAMELYEAERVGHGYRVVEDEEIYAKVKNANLHLECCPWSSFLTGAVPMGVKKHPIVRFAEDKINFSVNTDDPTITGYTLSEDYTLFQSWGLTEAQALRASVNAAKSSFLPSNEKKELVDLIKGYID